MRKKEASAAGSGRLCAVGSDPRSVALLDSSKALSDASTKGSCTTQMQCEAQSPELPPKDRDLLYKLAAVALPSYPMGLVGRCVGLCSAALVGHLGDTSALAAVGLCNVITNITGYSWLWGLSSAISTKSAQDWGARNYSAIGVTLQRGYLVLLCLADGPLVALWLLAEPLLRALGQHPDVCKLVGIYVKIRIPGIFFMTANCVLSRTLSSMSNMNINLMMSVTTAIINVSLSFILVPRLGFIGAPITATVCDILESLGILLLAARDKEFRMCWPGLSRLAWREWGPFLKISCPALFLLGIEWWTWDLQNFLAGLISAVAQATQAVAPGIADLQYNIGQALGTAASTVIGNLLGEGDATAARRAAKLVMILCLFLMAVQGVIFFVLRTHVARIFTVDSDILDAIAELMPLTLAFSFLDSHQAALTGIIQAAGRQYIAAPLVLVCYWVIGVPIGVALALGGFGDRWGLRGLWTGMLIAVCLHLSSFAITVACLDWEKVAEEVQERTRKEQQDLSGEQAAESLATMPGLDTLEDC